MTRKAQSTNEYYLLAAANDDLFRLYNTCGSYWGFPHLLLHKRLTKKNQILVILCLHKKTNTKV